MTQLAVAAGGFDVLVEPGLLGSPSAKCVQLLEVQLWVQGSGMLPGRGSLEADRGLGGLREGRGARSGHAGKAGTLVAAFILA